MARIINLHLPSSSSFVRFSRIKGFGFILPDDESGDLFVHQTNIEVEGFRSLDENQRVEFAIAEGEDGKKRATEVVAIDP